MFFAIGQAILLSSTLAILPHYFERKIALANGLMNFLAAIIVVAMPILTSLIVRHYSLVETFYFLALLNFVAALMCLSFKPCLAASSDTFKSRCSQSFSLQVFKDSKYVIWCCTTFIGWNLDEKKNLKKSLFIKRPLFNKGMFGYLIPIITIVSERFIWFNLSKSFILFYLRIITAR